MPIKAGVVLVTKFVLPSREAFSGYINYIDRDEAIRNENFHKYNAFEDNRNIQTDTWAQYENYTNYMANPEKATGLFTAGKDQLSAEDKTALKQAFNLAQKNDSLMWQTVISFDNEWLKQNGIYDQEQGFINESKLKEVTRGCVKRMLDKENLSASSIWAADVHINTGNIHIHIATVEPYPMREKILRNGIEQYRGKFKQSSINAGKGFVINDILDRQIDNQRINEIIRNGIIGNYRSSPVLEYRKLVQFKKVHQMMPEDRRLWNYNMNAMLHIRPEIDMLTRMILEKDYAREYGELTALLEKNAALYTTAYGGENDYFENKQRDLYARFGNTVIRQLKQYDDQGRYTPRSAAYKRRGSGMSAGSAVKQIKRFMKSELDHLLNQREYRSMEEEIQ